MGYDLHMMLETSIPRSAQRALRLCSFGHTRVHKPSTSQDITTELLALAHHLAELQCKPSTLAKPPSPPPGSFLF